jgi:hypothetical protein
MRTFKWTIPEPGHPRSDDRAMDLPGALWWARVRARGVEWYVVSKGLAFLVAFPLLARSCFEAPLGAELLIESVSIGLGAGVSVWLWRERRYQQAVEQGIIPPS